MRRFFILFVFVFFSLAQAFSQNIVNQYVFSSNGRIIGFKDSSEYFGFYDGQLKIFKINGQKLDLASVTKFYADTQRIISAISPDGRLVAFAPYRGTTVSLYRFDGKLTLIDTFQTEAEIESFGLYKNYLVVGGWYDDTKALQLYSLKRKRVIAGDVFDSNIEFLRFLISKSGNFVVFVTYNKLTHRYSINYYHYNNGMFDKQNAVKNLPKVADLAFLSDKGTKIVALVGRNMNIYDNQLNANIFIRIGKACHLGLLPDYSKVYVTHRRFVEVFDISSGLKLDTTYKQKCVKYSFAPDGQHFLSLGGNFLRLGNIQDSLTVTDSVILPVNKLKFKALSDNLFVLSKGKSVLGVRSANLKLLNVNELRAKNFAILDSRTVLFSRDGGLFYWYPYQNTVASANVKFVGKIKIFNSEDKQFWAFVTSSDTRIYKYSDGLLKLIYTEKDLQARKLVSAYFDGQENFIAIYKNGDVKILDFKQKQLNIKHYNLGKKQHIYAGTANYLIAGNRRQVQLLHLKNGGKFDSLQTFKFFYLTKAFITPDSKTLVLAGYNNKLHRKVWFYQLPSQKQLYCSRYKKVKIFNEGKNLLIRTKYKKARITRILKLEN